MREPVRLVVALLATPCPRYGCPFLPAWPPTLAPEFLGLSAPHHNPHRGWSAQLPCVLDPVGGAGGGTLPLLQAQGSPRASPFTHPSTHPFAVPSCFSPEGRKGARPVEGGAVGFFLVIGHLLPASPGVFGACLHKVDAGCNSVMNSMNTNPLLPLTLGSLKDQNQTI